MRCAEPPRKKRRRKNGRGKRGGSGMAGTSTKADASAGQSASSGSDAPAAGKGQRTRGPQKLKFTYKEQKDYETIEADMAKLEEQIAALDQAIEASASDFVKLNQLMAEKEEAEAAWRRKWSGGCIWRSWRRRLPSSEGNFDAGRKTRYNRMVLQD